MTTVFGALGETQLGIPPWATAPLQLLPLLLAAAAGIETRHGVGGEDVGERQRGEVQPEQLMTLDVGGGERILTVGLSARCWGAEGVARAGLVELIGGANETCCCCCDLGDDSEKAGGGCGGEATASNDIAEGGVTGVVLGLVGVTKWPGSNGAEPILRGVVGACC